MSLVEGRSDLRDRSTRDLVKDLSQQASLLVRQEIELAKTEVAEKGKKAGTVAGLLAGAALAAVLMLGALTAFLILALDQAMPDWGAAIVVTLVWGAVAVVLALVGRDKAQEIGTPVPEKTVESVKEDIEWLKHPTS